MIQTRSLSSDEDILSFLKQYCDFGPNRLYILLAMARPKENKNITHNSIPIFRELITKEEKITEKYNKLKLISENHREDGEKLTFRYYFSANARDIDKAFYLYQKKLLEMQRDIHNGHTATQHKIKRLDKEWMSMLQKSGNKDDNYFIIDIDKSEKSILNKIYNGIEKETTIKECIQTPNGYHLITDPFNPNQNILDEEYIEIKKDDLFFLSKNN